MKQSFLFVCYKHQYDHFLKSHIDAINCLPEYNADFILCDIDMSLSRSGFFDMLYGIRIITAQLKTKKYKNVISITPKAGLLTCISSFFTKVNQIHWFTGQVWANNTGILKIIKRLPDLIISKFAIRLLCDSHPQKNYLLHNGFISFENKFSVPGAGSICGIDDNIFFAIPERSNKSFSKDVETRFGIVGRINKDKGVLWLLEAIKDIPDKYRYKFIFIGNIDGDKDFKKSFLESVNNNSNIDYLGEIFNKKEIYSSFDVLLCCSFREGFSNTIIESQAFYKPVIVRDIYGVKSSFIENKTGLIFSNQQNFIENLHFFSAYKNQLKFGKDGFKFVEKNFRRSKVINNCLKLYLQE